MLTRNVFGILLFWPLWALGLCGFVVRVGSSAASLFVACPSFALLFLFSVFSKVTSTADLSIWQSLNCKGRRPKNRHLVGTPCSGEAQRYVGHGRCPPVLVLYFVTDQGSHFVMGAVLGLRIVVPEASQRPCGRLLRQRQYVSSQTFRGPCGQLLLAAAILRRCGVTVCLQLRLRQTLSQVSLVGSTLVGELARGRAKLAFMVSASTCGLSSIVSSALLVTGGAMVDDDCNEG